MMSIDQLGGVLQVRPGVARPATLTGTRPDWSAQLAPGRPAHALPGMLAAIHSLCSHAHRLCAQAAVDAALGRDTPPAEGARTLRRETLREHLRRILLDWPRLPGATLADAAGPAPDVLAGCPAFSAGADDGSLLLWIERQLLGGPAQRWLAAHERDPVQAWERWCEGSSGWLAQCMRRIRPLADVPLSGAAPLRVHADDMALRGLAGALRDDDGFSRRPQVCGACAETGSWTRLNDPAGTPRSAWLRLGARVAELVRLALPDTAARSGTAWLRSGSLALSPGEGLAWIEMARGLLVHHVMLDGHGEGARIAACHVLAPTEWNFHPDGAVACALEALPESGSMEQVAVLMAAYDPCVRYDLLQRHGEHIHA